MRGRHSGATPYPRPKSSKSEPLPDHIEGDLMDGRKLFEPFIEPQNDTKKDEDK